MNEIPHVAVGCAHGRFQPPHKGHLEYLLAAKACCDFLWVGITRYDLYDDAGCEIATHRVSRPANPLTYFERVNLLTAILEGAGIGRCQFGFIPFPIDRPSRLPQFLPTSVTCFTTIYEEWNHHKIKVLQEEGYRVVVLWSREEKQFSGQAVRESIRNGTQDWVDAVPSEIVPALKQINLAARIP